ncbi:MAG: type II toxin-antitoxin system HicB family antitoxin [Fimbriiglobus sp.]
MTAVKFIHWQEGDMWLGYLQDAPEYWTQGQTLEDLIEHLLDIHRDLPVIRGL